MKDPVSGQFNFLQTAEHTSSNNCTWGQKKSNTKEIFKSATIVFFKYLLFRLNFCKEMEGAKGQCGIKYVIEWAFNYFFPTVLC